MGDETADPAAHGLRPRTVALWAARRGDALLVFEGRDREASETYCRPLGGGVEYGELSRDAVVREVREELGVDLVRPRLLATLENVFRHEGELRHEILFIYDGEPSDPAFYRDEAPVAFEADGSRFRTRWLPLADVRAGAAVLYPDGLLDVLDASSAPDPDAAPPSVPEP